MFFFVVKTAIGPRVLFSGSFREKLFFPLTEIYITGRYLGLLYYWFLIGTRINSRSGVVEKKFVPWQLQNGGQAEPE